MDKTLVNAFKYVVTLSHPNPPQQITGYEYQFLACRQALLDGPLEPREMPLDETLYIMQLMDNLRRKWGVRYPMDWNILKALIPKKMYFLTHFVK